MWNNVDLKSSWKWYCAFIVYLMSLMAFPNIAYSEVNWMGGQPVVNNNVYLYLQFFTCIFIVNITSSMFGESFRREAYEYLMAYPLTCFSVIFARVFKLLTAVCAVYIPVVLYLFNKVNRSIIEYANIFPEYAGFPLVNIFIPAVQCLVSVIFYITITLFLLNIFKDDKLPAILMMTYCALEAGPLSRIFGKYSIFRGSFNVPDYYSFFPRIL